MNHSPLVKRYPYLLSLGIHALLLLILAFLSINVKQQTQWHQIDWYMDTEEEVISAGTKAASENIPDDTAAKDEPRTASSTEQNQQVIAIESPLLETPKISDQVIEPEVSRDPVLTEALSATLRNPDSGQANSGIFTVIEGGSDAFFIRESKPKIQPLEDDQVIVEFALKRDGTIDMNSVNVISYRRAAHWEALRAEMHNWRFGFTGAYDASKRYRIRCNFTLQ
ncbi:MAG: hypothetical protein PWP64_67 [Candidatus Cloacimonadota bacterium]|nr:hypothetical protein [Candidatus Cloacimonadota bacterium]